MNFKEATDSLFERISHEKLAEALDVSVASIRQARLVGRARAHRAPPPDWEGAAIALATQRIMELSRLAKTLKNQRNTNLSPKNKKNQ